MTADPAVLEKISPSPASREIEVSVIVPTYREAENLPVLVPKISDALERAGLTGEILIVDDNSPDDTEPCCRELALSYPLRLLIRREERGLSSAVVHGLRQARGRVLVVMDADLSHPPEKVPDLVGAVESGQGDFVIGSRYVAGGSTEEGWGVYRWLNSKVATLLAWPLASARDPLAGFFALNRTTFESANRLDPVGYKIGLELMVKCRCRKVKEVPIAFGNRLHGASKLSLKEQVNYLRHLKRLYEYRLGVLAQASKFLLVGATGVVVDLLVFSMLLLLLPAAAARAVAIGTAMTWNFAWNRRLTFPSARRRLWWQQYGLFCLSCLLGAVVNWSVFVGLSSTFEFCADWPILAATAGIGVGAVFNFLLSKYVAFR
jgi:dolichol-phosphate mannosyltransferase